MQKILERPEISNSRPAEIRGMTIDEPQLSDEDISNQSRTFK